MSDGHSSEFLDKMRVLAPLLQNYPPLASMPFDDLCDWMSWYWNRGTMVWRISDFNEPQGVCLIRLFRRLEQFMDRDVHEPCGRFAFIELSVASDPIIMGLMFNDMTSRWGPQEVVMWDRGERTEQGTPRMYRWHQFRKLARRLSYGITETA